MAELTEEEKEILYRAHEIKERIRAEELEAGEITLEEAKRREEQELKGTFGPDAGGEEEYEDDQNTEAFSWERGDASDEEPVLFTQDLPEAGVSAKTRRRQKKQEKEIKKMQKEKQRERQRKTEDRERPRRPHKKKGPLRRLLKLLLILILVFAVLAVAAYAVIRLFMAQTNYQPYETAYTRADDVASSRFVTNILLIGTDNRAADDASRSDAMILVSINQKKGRLVMTSILRDCYVNIPGYGQNRLNHAYQMGGPALLIQTIEENFKVGVDYYVQVDFYDFIDVIDALGGVDIEVTDAEVNYINGYISELNHKENELAGFEQYPEGYSFLNSSGYQTLNGRQALGYARIRAIGTDFARTGRQRTVLNALLAKMKANPLRLLKACHAILPDLTTNIGDDRMTSLVMSAPVYLFYKVVQNQVPVDGYWWNTTMENGQEVLGIDFNGNNASLRSTIYD